MKIKKDSIQFLVCIPLVWTCVPFSLLIKRNKTASLRPTPVPVPEKKFLKLNRKPNLLAALKEALGENFNKVRLLVSSLPNLSKPPSYQASSPSCQPVTYFKFNSNGTFPTKASTMENPVIVHNLKQKSSTSLKACCLVQTITYWRLVFDKNLPNICRLHFPQGLYI